ncbi:CPBP family intramembrane glutamic endopeptidase [Enterococcus sp. LJL98]
MVKKSHSINLVIIPIVLYFLIELFSRTLFFWIPNNMQNLKIFRDIFTIITYLFLLKKYNYISNDDLKINFKIITIFGGIIAIFIYFFTEQAQSNYPLYHIFSAIFISPIIEELICRKFIYDFFLTHFNIFTAVIVSSLFFILLHFSTSLSTNGFYFSMSLIFTLTRALSGSVTNSVIVHFISNLIMAIRM